MMRGAAAAALTLFFVTGCASWSPGWQSAPITSPAASDAVSPLSRGDAREALLGATDGATLRTVAKSWDVALEASSDDRELLSDLADVHILYGAAWAQSAAEKGEWYRAGIRYAERAMATNERFRARVDAGEPIGEAVAELGSAETRTMLLWVTGVSYYFKECLGVSKLWHFRWMPRTRKVMERMLAVDPQFGGGAVLFSLGIYHLASPPGAGRDLELSRDYLDRAVAASPTSLLTRWGRAKYYAVLVGDREAFVRDLEWVVAQDPRAPDNTLPWNLYFQRDAKAMLDVVESYF